MKMTVLLPPRVLIIPNNALLDYYLNAGTGNAWAGQSSTKLFACRLLNDDENCAVAKEGAFAPTGSN